jgi:cell division protein FtsW (lipid II flippase)
MRYLPDSHTDFIFGVGVEGSGIVILCLAALAVFVVRKMWRA